MAVEIPKLTTEEIFSLLVQKIRSNEFELVSYEHQKPCEKIGLLGDHVIITTTVNILTNEVGAVSHENSVQTFTFFAKFFPTNETQAVFCRETGAFTKEVFIYELFNKIKESGIRFLNCVPDCYFLKQNHAIVTENLSEIGYGLVDKMKTLDYDTVLLVLTSLAKLHASTIIYEEQQSKILGRAYTLLEDYESNFEETFYNDKKDFINLKGVEAAIKGILSEIDIFNCPENCPTGKNFKSVAKEACFKVYELIKRTNRYRNVICHGDLWATNFLLKYDKKSNPVDCKFVDFQCARYLPPSHDVMSVLYLNTTREFRKKHMYELIGIYYTNLEKILKLSGIGIKDIIPFNDFLESCEVQKLFAIYQCASHFQLVLIDNNLLEDFFSDVEFSMTTFSKDRTPLVLRNINNNERYRKRLEESILDLKNFCDYL